ncbi:MAG: hypothetical protein HYY04_09085 [Chloroflexi bacterium]|nr:hypothetical protein [Chloroflexota bacterium]
MRVRQIMILCQVARCLLVLLLEAIINVAVPTLLQTAVPDELRGRVFSVQNVVFTVLFIAGMGLAGAAAEVLPVQTIMSAGGVIAALGGLAGLRLLAEPARAQPVAEVGG